MVDHMPGSPPRQGARARKVLDRRNSPRWHLSPIGLFYKGLRRSGFPVPRSSSPTPDPALAAIKVSPRNADISMRLGQGTARHPRRGAVVGGAEKSRGSSKGDK